MPRDYPPLPTTLLHPGASFAEPAQTLPERVTADSAAVDVMTDLRKVSAILIRQSDSVDEAHARMKQRGVRLLLVVNPERRVLGIVTATDILGEKPMQQVQSRGIRHQDVTVGDIMTAQPRLEVLAMSDVEHARVGNIVATLRQSGRQHAAVVDVARGGEHIVRGLFSVTQIARQLGLPLHTSEVARTFAEIELALAG